MPDTPIPPALSPEEWRATRYEAISSDGVVFHDEGDGVEIVLYPDNDARADRRGLDDKIKLYNWAPGDRHAFAAICLYGQPFGFTREERDTLREYVDSHEGVTGEAAVFARLAAKIAALLPPTP